MTPSVKGSYQVRLKRLRHFIGSFFLSLDNDCKNLSLSTKVTFLDSTVSQRQFQEIHNSSRAKFNLAKVRLGYVVVASALGIARTIS